MKKIIAAILLLGILTTTSCRVTQVPIETSTQYTYIDSVRYVDSIIYVDIPKERIVDIVPAYDTLTLETDLAKSVSYIDTLTHSLRGTIVNKDTVLPANIKWKEKISYRDTVITKEVPVEVVKEVTKYPTSYWIFLTVTIIVVVFIGFKIYFKIKK